MDKTERLLNDRPSFRGASDMNSEGYAKVSLGGESFWIKNCFRHMEDIIGIVDNRLLFSDRHFIHCGDKVRFKPTK